jgi:hypothetical protein
MVLDDLLNDEPAMRRLAGLLRKRAGPATHEPVHASFLDQAALYEELATRFGEHGQTERREPTLARRKY